MGRKSLRPLGSGKLLQTSEEFSKQKSAIRGKPERQERAALGPPSPSIFCDCLGTARESGTSGQMQHGPQRGWYLECPSRVRLQQVLWKESWVSPPRPLSPTLYHTSPPFCACFRGSSPTVPGPLVWRGLSGGAWGGWKPPTLQLVLGTVGSSRGLCDHKHLCGLDHVPRETCGSPATQLTPSLTCHITPLSI